MVRAGAVVVIICLRWILLRSAKETEMTSVAWAFLDGQSKVVTVITTDAWLAISF